MNLEKKQNIISIITDNEPGALSRIIALFSSQGYNIDSLNVDTANVEDTISRITIATTVTDKVMAQMINKIERLVPVHYAKSLDEDIVKKELAFIKVNKRINEDLMKDYGATLISSDDSAYIYQLVDRHRVISAFVEAIAPNLIEFARTGSLALEKGHRKVEK